MVLLRGLVIALSLGVSSGMAMWKKKFRSSDDTKLWFTVGIKHSAESLDRLKATFFDVSNPTSDSYGAHLSADDVNALMAPPDEHVTAVIDWIKAVVNDASLVWNTAGDFVSCSLTVKQAELLLPGATYHAYEKNGHIVHRVEAGSFVLPPHVDFVSPTTRFPAPLTAKVSGEGDAYRAKKKSETSDDDHPILGSDPSSIREMYDIGTYEASGAEGNSQHVAGFLDNYMSESDLQTFFAWYYPEAIGNTPNIVGPNNQNSPTTEGSLDIQYIMAIGAQVPTTYWYTSGTRPYDLGDNEPFLTWLWALGNTTDAEIPTVISVSYADEEYVIDEDFQQRCDVEFQKLGVRGASLFFGSGDDGVTGDKGICYDDKFVPWWPASSPYVTAVGATEEYELNQAATFSGGGYSNRYGIQDYQADAIAQYKVETISDNPPVTYYNNSGAGFPDLAAVGMNYWTYVGGLPTEVGGTSAATPTVAGIFSLLNDARLAAGKSPLGPLNQLIYANADAFTDVTTGSNPGGGGCGIGGFQAARGWDPVTGMGTPIFPKLMEVVMALNGTKRV